MRRNCNLELGLFPPYDDSGHRHHHHHHHNQPMLEEVGDSPMQKHQGQRWQRQQEEQQHHHQQLTIFYAGKICVSDVTELQAKSILMLANKKVEEKGIMRTPTTSPVPSSPAIVQSSNNNNNNQLNNGSGTGLSMKRSLQRFLQKRKTRIQEASPYHQSL